MGSGLLLTVPVTIVIAYAMTTVHGKQRVQETANSFLPPLLWTVFSIAFTLLFQVAPRVGTTLALRAERITAVHTRPLSLTRAAQVVANRCIFFTGPRGNKFLRFRFWYAICMRRRDRTYRCPSTPHALCASLLADDYNMIFANTLVGIAVIGSRCLLWLVLGVFCLGRIDFTLMPGNSNSIDGCHPFKTLNASWY